MADLTKTGTKLAVGLLVVGVLFAFLLPVAIDPIAGDRTDTLNQTEDTTYALTGIVDVNATRINNTQGEVDVTLTNTDNGDTATVTGLAEGNNQTVTLSGSSITVKNENVSDSTHATIKYTYPETTGWDSGTTALYGLLPVFFILVAVLYVVRKTT